jgi:hypothetical protein
MYAAIRRMRGDVRAIARNTGIPEHVIRAVRRHLFLGAHEIPIGPNQTMKRRFIADEEVAQLWTCAAGKGAPLTAEGMAAFRRIIAHEYVEYAMMMHGGMPYRSSDPVAWAFEREEWAYSPKPGAFGAHDVAPIADWQTPPWRHYPGLGLGEPRGRSQHGYPES